MSYAPYGRTRARDRSRGHGARLTFYPTALTGGVFGWDPTPTAGYTNGVGALVASLIDQDPTTPTVTLAQATGAKQPTRTVDANFGGNASITDTGGIGTTTLLGSAASDATFVSNGVGMTLFIVGRYTSDTNRYILDNAQGVTTALGFTLRTTAVNSLVFSIGNGATNVILQTVATAVNTPHVMILTHKTGDTGADFHWRIDRASVATQNNTNAPSASNPPLVMALGNFTGAAPTQALLGGIALVWAWNRVLTATEQAQLEAYSLSRFGV